MAMTDLKLLSDHFTTWSASPYHLLHPCGQQCLQPYLSWGTSRKANKTWTTLNKLKQKKQKNKTFERRFGFDSKDVCFGCPYIVFLVLKWKHQKKHYFFEWV